MAWFDEAAKKLGVPLHHHSDAEAHGPCPACGGEDRFIVWRAGNAWCRQCKMSTAWLRGEDAKRSAAEGVRRKASRRRDAAWRVLTQGHVWVSYHRACLESEEALAEWEKSGIGMQEVLKWGLGYADPCPVYSESASLVIPVFGNGRLLDIRHRLVNPGEKGGKYRGEFPGLPAQLFNADVVRKGSAVVVEGEKKAIVLDKAGIGAVGVAGASHGRDALVGVRSFSAVVAFDPGAGTEARRMAQALTKAGCRVWVADFPAKCDDFLLEYGVDLTKEVLRQARRCRSNGGGKR